ncbi:LssY C-terminal domain-containing protein [Enterovirga rhinocerotis]|uniref:LssY-like putative type I secretion system component LssY n=1 Tax=Enterovirga rhinocerotis TaxID=1339210 RepID=A0A4R7C8B4_9HYPH|nr:LssY C-terminal domain-containing protein [Enterovirga rhinocerotis]TDR94860.1 LssY-like putative type I secretion system component LssY [Enterovirga rhinocerotis]
MSDSRERARRFRRTRLLGIIFLAYGFAAYLVAPELWKTAERFWGGAQNPMLTQTTAGIPGDPINVGLVGDKAAVIRAFAEAGWDTADPITLATSVEIGLDVLFRKPFPDAPVSTLLFQGRPQTLTFEKEIGTSPNRRHHVRFWLMPDKQDGRDTWLGSASLDVGSGVSHDTGQITHHIGPDVDAERDLVIADLTAAGAVERSYEIPGSGATQDRRNGGGDRYFTDGEAKIAVLKPYP